MISIILEERNGKEVARTSLLGNEAYLAEDNDFELLGAISEISYDVFASGDMPKLVRELRLVRSTLEDEEEKTHIDEIISLADQCSSNLNLVLTFTPFGDE